MSHSSTEASVTRDFWPKLKKSLARIPFAEDVLAAFYCAVDPATPLKAKGILLAALAYFIMPFDVIPDWIPVLGHIDDAFVVSLALKSVRADLDTFMAWETARI